MLMHNANAPNLKWSVFDISLLSTDFWAYLSNHNAGFNNNHLCRLLFNYNYHLLAIKHTGTEKQHKDSNQAMTGATNTIQYKQ